MTSSAKLNKWGEVVKDSIVEEWMMELIDDVTCGLCFEIHRSCKKGYFLMDESDIESQKQYQIVNKKGLDVFGQPSNVKKQVDCTCPNCHRNLAASRFAPHLEKCMGMGRISSRIASRRIASGTQLQKKALSDHDSNESESEDNYKPDKKAKKSKKEKSSNFSKKKKKSKQSADNSPQNSSTSNTPILHHHNEDDDYFLDI